MKACPIFKSTSGWLVLNKGLAGHEKGMCVALERSRFSLFETLKHSWLCLTHFFLTCRGVDSFTFLILNGKPWYLILWLFVILLWVDEMQLYTDFYWNKIKVVPRQIADMNKNYCVYHSEAWVSGRSVCGNITVQVTGLQSEVTFAFKICFLFQRIRASILLFFGDKTKKNTVLPFACVFKKAKLIRSVRLV